MPNVTLDQLSALRGKPVIDANGEKVGEVDQAFYDEESNEPRWVEVKRGMFGMDEVLVPVQGAKVQDVELHVPFLKERIESAPEPEELRALSPRSEEMLERHYGVSMSSTANEPAGQPVNIRLMRVWVWPSKTA
jgi:sporulation protein YlmC with PRC-barrel domain